MKILVSRVHEGSVTIESEVVSSIANGLALFVGIEKGDEPVALSEMAEKVVNLRIFENEEGKFHYSVKDKNYSILCVSNFTLCANTKKGRRPSFEQAMSPQEANKIFDDFVSVLKSKGVEVKTGIFGKHMGIDLEMDGPVNIMLYSRENERIGESERER